MATLDTLAAQAVFAARALERAVHDAGPWEITWGPHTVPAVREATEESVTFTATFPEHCYLAPIESPATLLCRGEPVLFREIEFPGDQGFTISWVLSGASMQAA